LFVIPFMMDACIVPPPLETQSDGGGFHKVTINRNLTYPPLPNLSVFQSKDKARPETQDFVVVLEDADDGTDYIRVFLNSAKESDYPPQYNTFVPISQDRIAGKGRRALPFSITGLCDALTNYTTGTFILSLWASDTEFVSSGDDDLRHNVGDGYRDDVSWKLVCQARSPSISDGGL
jgi:hypothetical protein